MFSLSQTDETIVVNIEEVDVIIDTEELDVLEHSCGSAANPPPPDCRPMQVSTQHSTDFGDPALLPTSCTSSRKVHRA
jgi:hypothetical protein